MNKELVKKVLKSLPQEIKEAELALESSETYSFEISDNQIKNINYANNEEYFVRVRGEKEGYYYTQDGNEDPYQMFMKAYENSKIASKKKDGNYNINYQAQFLNKKNYSLVELKEKALAIFQKINKDIKEGTLSLQLIVKNNKMMCLNNLGLDIYQEFPTYLLIGYLDGKDDDYPISVRSDLVLNELEDDLSAFIEDLNERYLYQKKPLNGFESGEYKVILHHNFVYVLLCTAWQLFSGKKLLEGATCLKGDLGKKISCACLNIIDDNIGFNFKADTEGSICKDIKIVEKGIFKDVLLNNETSKKLNMDNNGCAGRKPLLFGNIATDIQITPRNFKMVKGELSFEEMKEQLKDGLIITEHFDIFHSLDISSGEFAIPCYGVKIENGKEVGNFRALVISGNIKDLCLNILAVSNRGFIRPMHYLNNYGIAACDLLINKMKVAGE